jgi:hypothetical protein
MLVAMNIGIRSGVVPFLLDAPFLEWPGADPTTNNLPTLYGTFNTSIVGYDIHLVGSNNPDAVQTWLVDQVNNIDSDENTAMLAAFSTGALANGTWYFKCRIELSGSALSQWSNVVSHVISA